MDSVTSRDSLTLCRCIVISTGIQSECREKSITPRSVNKSQCCGKTRRAGKIRCKSADPDEIVSSRNGGQEGGKVLIPAVQFNQSIMDNPLRIIL